MSAFSFFRLFNAVNVQVQTSLVTPTSYQTKIFYAYFNQALSCLLRFILSRVKLVKNVQA